MLYYIQKEERKGVEKMKHNLLYVNCLICGKQLIDLSLDEENFHEYWCDECNIDIRVKESEEDE